MTPGDDLSQGASGDASGDRFDDDRIALDSVPCCVWLTTPELLASVLATLGDPVDSYVNGSQVWIDDHGPGDVVIEWRLHPVAGYQRPAGMASASVFPDVALGITELNPRELWDGLEAFPAYHDPVEPAALAKWATARIGFEPTAAGRANHDAIADRWERSGRNTSIVTELITELGGGTPSPE